MFVGEGNNGKSTLIRVMESLLGTWNCSNLALQDFGGRFSLADLYGKMANIHADLSSEELRTTGKFKMLTGGDTISSEMKFRQKRISFRNYAKLIFSCNQLPKTPDDTGAFFRRWIILNFPNTFEGQAEKGLGNALTKPELLSGVLNKALPMLKTLLLRTEFSYSVSTEEMREMYIRMSDSAAAFFMDRLEFKADGCLIKKEVYSTFLEYCRQKRCPVVSERLFFQRLYQTFNIEETQRLILGERKRAFLGIYWKEGENNEKI